MLAEDQDNRMTFDEKLNLLLDKAGYPKRGRAKIITDFVPVTKPAALYWLKGATKPTDETLALMQPLVEHLVDRVENKSIKAKEVYSWLTRPNAPNPFDSLGLGLIPKKSLVYNPQHVLRVSRAIYEVAEEEGISIDSIPPNALQGILDAVLEESYKDNVISKLAIRSLLKASPK